MRAAQHPYRLRVSHHEIITLVAIGCVMASAMIPALSIDMAAVLALALIVAGGVLDPDLAVLGFGNPVVITVAGMFIVAEALHQTGAVEGLTDFVQRRGRKGQRALLIALLPVVMVLSGFMNNTGVVVLLLPALVSVAQRLEVSPSRLLLPLSYASITGGTLTLVGTTTTLLVDGLVRSTEVDGAALQGIGFFDILPMGLVFCAVSLAYLVLIGPRLLPDRPGMVTAITPGTTREYMTEIVVAADSQLVGRALADVPELFDGIRVLQLVRGEVQIPPPFQRIAIEPEDVLLLKGAPEDLVDILGRRGVVHPRADIRSGRMHGVNLSLAEVMVPPRSKLDGRTVDEAGLRERFGIVVLAVLRRGEHLRKQLGAVRLRMGDVLLVQGDAQAVERVSAEEDDIIRLGGEPPHAPNTSRAPLAVFVALTALGSAALIPAVPLWTAVMVASVILVVGGCLNSSQAYRAINLKIVVILACMLGLGAAVKETGLADRIADYLVSAAGPWGDRGVLAMIYLATLLITELVTNAATAGIMVPIAISTAASLGVSHEPFVFAIALAASCSFLTPVGYQTNLLVYGPGGYRLQDYLRLGAPLSFILWIIAIVLLPIVFPFHP